MLADIRVVFDEVSLTAGVQADLQAFSDDGADIFLDGIGVGLAEDGEPIPDLLTGPPTLDDSPFFALPFSLSNGEVLQNRLLFALSGLVPGTNYSGFFDLQFSGDGVSGLTSRGDFAFATPAAAVPEPGTLLLMATGCALLFRQQRKRR